MCMHQQTTRASAGPPISRRANQARKGFMTVYRHPRTARPAFPGRVPTPIAVAVFLALPHYSNDAHGQQQGAAVALSAARPVEEVVVVSSRNRVEALQDVPISIAVVSGERLQQ